jgi:hypothetical protein
MEACAQLREYSNYFDQDDNRDKVLDAYGLLAYKPKMFIIIGRTGDINPIIRKKIEISSADIKVQTYDDIIQKIKRKIS